MGICCIFGIPRYLVHLVRVQIFAAFALVYIHGIRRYVVYHLVRLHGIVVYFGDVYLYRWTYYYICVIFLKSLFN
jgi:hypothetical protein